MSAERAEPIAGVAPRWVTVAEAAAMLRVSRTRLYELLAQGQLRSVREGRRRLVLVDSIVEYQDRKEREA